MVAVSKLRGVPGGGDGGGAWLCAMKSGLRSMAEMWMLG